MVPREVLDDDSTAALDPGHSTRVPDVERPPRPRVPPRAPWTSRRYDAWAWWSMRTPRSARDVDLDRVADDATMSLARAVEFCSSHFVPKSRRYGRGRGDTRMRCPRGGWPPSEMRGKKGRVEERGSGERGYVTGATQSHTRRRGYEVPPWPSPPPSPPAMAASFPSPRASP
jgi:hypothetical protein